MVVAAQTKPTAPERGASPATGPQVIGFEFSFSLTADDLAKLSPEQITALYKAVGELMAIKATLERSTTE